MAQVAPNGWVWPSCQDKKLAKYQLSVWVSLMIRGELAQDSQRTKLQSSQFGEVWETCIWLIRGISCLSSNLKTLDENLVRLILKALVTGASQLLSLVRLTKHLSVCLSIIYYLKMVMLYNILVLVMMILDRYYKSWFNGY